METLIRLTVALGIFGIMVVWELISPKRPQKISRQQRWPVNLGLAVFNMLMMRLIAGSIAYVSAVMAMELGWGLLNWLVTPYWLAILFTLLVLDIAIYGQHIVMHKWPVLWRLHQVHHSDLEFDATTAVRFHPLEILLSMVIKLVCIFLIGANPLAVVIFEVILNGAATFNHSNISIPETLDKKLRWLLITPDMHRIHHSIFPDETDTNYGFSISCWDRIFKTYRAEPKMSQTIMEIGLRSFRQVKELGFMQLMLLPFKSLRMR